LADIRPVEWPILATQRTGNAHEAAGRLRNDTNADEKAGRSASRERGDPIIERASMREMRIDVYDPIGSPRRAA
jgi:hypothetical protein